MTIFSSGGINWTWYIDATLDGDTAHINRHWRLHDTRDAGRHPETEGGADLAEDDARTVYRLDVYSGPHEGRYRVTNPAHVFSYDQPTED